MPHAVKRDRQDRLEHVDVEQLRLDPENPRLPEATRLRTQDELVRLLLVEFSLTELGRSLAENGYFHEEPLAAVSKTVQGRNEFLVVEGNRRLAALKLLTDAKLRKRLQATEWDEFAKHASPGLSKPPVIVYEHRRDLLNFMGFRHITGVKPWDPLAKARFIHSLVNDYGMDFEGAARTVGNKPPAIRQQYLAYCAYLQARDVYGMDIDRVERVYSTFQAAMRNASLRTFIGISAAKGDAKSPREMQSPVPRSRAENLREVISWVAGDTGGVNPVITENSQIPILGEIVESQPALSTLRASRSIVAAKQLTAGEENRLLQNLHQASVFLDLSLPDVHRHRTSRKVLAAVERCVQTADQLRKALGK